MKSIQVRLTDKISGDLMFSKKIRVYEKEVPSSCIPILFFHCCSMFREEGTFLDASFINKEKFEEAQEIMNQEGLKYKVVI